MQNFRRCSSPNQRIGLPIIVLSLIGILICLAILVFTALAVFLNRAKRVSSDRFSEKDGLRIAPVPSHWSSLSQVIGLKLESREVPTNLNVTSVLKLQKRDSFELSKVNGADENEHVEKQRFERESRTLQARKDRTQHLFYTSASNPKRTSEIDSVQGTTERVNVVERNCEMTSADLQTPGNKTWYVLVRASCRVGFS